LAGAFSVLTPAQIANYASLQKLTEQQLLEILDLATLSKEQKDQIMNMYLAATATNTYTGAAGGATVATGGLAAGLKGLTAVIAANPWGFVITALATIITLSISWQKAQEKAFQEAIDNAKKLQNEYEATVDTLKDNMEAVQSLSTEFSKLSVGVDDKGNNISLTNEQYDRYLEIVNKLVGINPSLVKGWDDENQAIIDKNSAIASTIELLKQQRQLELQKVTTADNNWDILEGLSNQYSKEMDAVEDEVNKIRNAFVGNIEFNKGYKDNHVFGNKDSWAALFDQIAEAYGLDPAKVVGFDSKTMQSGWAALYKALFGVDMAKQANFTEQELRKLASFDYTKLFGILDNDIYSQFENATNRARLAVSQLDNAANAYQSQLQRIAQASTGWDKLSDGSQSFINTWITTMKIGEKETESSAQAMTDNLQTMITLLSSGTEDGNLLQSKIDSLFALDFSKMNANQVEQWYDVAENAIGDIQEILSHYGKSLSDDDIAAIRASIGLDLNFEINGQPATPATLVDAVKAKFKERGWNEDDVNGLNLGELKAFFTADLTVYSSAADAKEGLFPPQTVDNVNSLKTALAGLSDETTVLRDAMAKLDEGSAAFDKWIGSDDNLKSLLDKFPDLRDELEAYNNALAAGEDPQKAFITLQRAMNAALQDFNTDAIYDGINDVVSACDTYGASSNQVLQAVQNLDRFIPGLVDKLYTEENGLLTVASGANFSAAAIYNAAKETIELEKVVGKAKFDVFVAEVDNVSDALMRMGGTAAIAVGGLNPYKSLQEAKDQYIKDLDSLLASLNGAYRRINSNNKKSKSEKEVYVPDVDPLYQYLQAVEDINDELDGLDIDEKLLDEDDFEGKNRLIGDRIEKLEELKTALHELNNARDVEIHTAVGKLNGYGDFQATYDAESGQALINNMDALKHLTGDTAKAAEELISTIENGSKAAISTSKEYMEALVEQNAMLKEQRELQGGASDDRIERHSNAISLLKNQQSVYEGNLDYQAAVQSLKEQKSHWVEIQNIAHQMAEDIRAAHPGITNDDPLLKKWIDTWWEANGEIKTANERFVEDSLARLDSFIQQADNFNWWDHIDTTKVDMLEKKLATIHQLYADGIIPDAATYKKLVDETAKEIYDEKLNAIERVIDYTKKLIEEEVRLRKEELEEQVDDYKKIVDLKKESLRVSKDEADYQRSVAEKTKAIAKLQQQINTLSLSDDRRDIAERKKLEEELAELQGELADTQADHTLEAQEKALDDSYNAFEQEKNDEIKKLEATIDTEGKLYALAINRIDRDWNTLYDDLMQMNSLYWDGIAGEAGIKGAWDTAKQAAEGYKGTLETIQGIEKERAAVSGTGTSVGSSVVSDKSAAYLTGDIDKQKKLQAIGAEMQTNSQMWHTAYNANNKGQMEALQKANQRLAKQVKDLTGQEPVFDSRDGYWKLANGEHFYEVYHGGTKAVGSNEPWNLKSDEIMAKLQREEAVIPKDQVRPTLKFLEWGNSMASKARGLFSGGGLIASAMGNAVKGAPLSPAAGAIVNNNAPSFAPNINVEVKYDGSASPADAKRFGENITAGINEAFRRKGFGTGANPLGVTI